MDDPRMKGFRRRVAVAEALETIRVATAGCRTRSGPESVPLSTARGRVLATALSAERDVPSFDRAAMDGYAVRGEDTFGAGPYNALSLEVLGDSLPGRPFGGSVGPGQAVRIMTGAPLPAGADAVLPFEETEGAAKGDGRVRVVGSVAPKRHVGTRGEDLRKGAALLPEGRVLRAQDVALAAAAGHDMLKVRAGPTVCLIVTGEEIVAAGAEPEPYQTVDTNSLLLQALAARDGAAEVRVLRIAGSPGEIRRALTGDAAECDAIVVSGASSVGIEDHVPSVLAECGDLLVHGVAMRPSSPSGFGMCGGVPVFLLPGNPVSFLCAYDFFAGPVIRALAGLPFEWPYPAVAGVVRRKIVSELGRLDYVRVIREEDGVVPVATSGASILSSTVRADGFVLVPAESEGHGPGDTVTVHLYDSVPGGGP